MKKYKEFNDKLMKIVGNDNELESNKKMKALQKLPQKVILEKY